MRNQEFVSQKFPSQFSLSPVSSPTQWPTPFDCGLPPQTASQIDYRVKRLSRAFGLRDYDIDEIRSMFVLAVYKGLAGYEQSKSSPLTFAKHVIQMAYVRVALTLRAECDLRRRRRPLREVLDEVFVSGTVGGALECRETLEAVERRSPASRDLMFDLGHMTPAQSARHNGVHRGTVSRQIAQVRNANRDL